MARLPCETDYSSLSRRVGNELPIQQNRPAPATGATHAARRGATAPTVRRSAPASCYKRTSRNPRKETPVQLPSFKMSDKSLFAVLLRSPWWISFALALAVGAACFKLFPDRFAVVGALSGLPFAVIGGIAMWKQRGIPNPARIEEALQKLSALSARDFASTLEAAYAKDGYVVAKVTASGADLSVTKAGRTALVNSKRWKAATHGIEPIRELSAAMEALDANQGVYIAVNALSDAARTFASKNSIRVMQGTELALLMKAVTATGKRTT